MNFLPLLKPFRIALLELTQEEAIPEWSRKDVPLVVHLPSALFLLLASMVLAINLHILQLLSLWLPRSHRKGVILLAHLCSHLLHQLRVTQEKG